MSEGQRSSEGVADADALGVGRLGATARRTLLIAFLTVALVVVVSTLLVAFEHLHDRFGLGVIDGTRMALAEIANDGVLYPPLYDGFSYGGTRYMPIPIMLHAGLARIVGDYVAGGKLLAIASFLVVVALVFLVLRRRGCPLSVSMSLSASILATGVGFAAFTSLEGRGLPLALQLGAVILVDRSRTRPALIGAAGLCALAVLSNTSSLWGPIAITLWLILRDRRNLVLFVGSFGGFLGAGLLVFQLLTHGTLFENVFGLLFAGESGLLSSILRARRVAFAILADSAGLVAMASLALMEIVYSLKQRDQTVLHLALGSAVVILMVELTDIGVDPDHAVDVAVLVAILVGLLWLRVDVPRALSPAAALMGSVLIFTMLSSYYVIVRDPATEALRAALNGSASASFDPQPLDRYIAPDDVVLSTDPSIPSLPGQRPVVLDAYMYMRLVERHPEWGQDLLHRIESHEFDVVALGQDIGPVAAPVPDFYQEFRFGSDVIQSLRLNYRLLAEDAGFFIYVPKDDTSPGDEARPYSGTG